MSPWIRLILYLAAAPLVGGLLAGWDRRISARMQSRQGPPVLQPFYDVLKLWQKESIVVRRSQNYYILFFLLLVIFTGGLFFAGSDLLLVIFALTLAAIFFVLGAYKASSPYSFVGAERELIQMMAYEPMVLLTAIGMYMVTKSFYVHEIAVHPSLLVLALPGVFLGFLYTLEIKFRKSPFDLSCSHHAHQELVRGITTEFSGRGLAMIEIAHWYETVFLLGWVYLFFASWPLLGVLVSLAVFALVILVDNVFARLKWQAALKSAWLVALILGFGNIVALSVLRPAPPQIDRPVGEGSDAPSAVQPAPATTPTASYLPAQRNAPLAQTLTDLGSSSSSFSSSIRIPNQIEDEDDDENEDESKAVRSSVQWGSALEKTDT